MVTKTAKKIHFEGFALRPANDFEKNYKEEILNEIMDDLITLNGCEDEKEEFLKIFYYGKKTREELRQIVVKENSYYLLFSKYLQKLEDEFIDYFNTLRNSKRNYIIIDRDRPFYGLKKFTNLSICLNSCVINIDNVRIYSEGGALFVYNSNEPHIPIIKEIRRLSLEGEINYSNYLDFGEDFNINDPSNFDDIEF